MRSTCQLYLPAVVCYTVHDVVASHTANCAVWPEILVTSERQGHDQSHHIHVSHISTSGTCHHCLYPPIKLGIVKARSVSTVVDLQCCAMSKLASMLHFIFKAYAVVFSSATPVCSVRNSRHSRMDGGTASSLELTTHLPSKTLSTFSAFLICRGLAASSVI
jgi:hypothetical protein